MPRTPLEPRFQVEYLSILDSEGTLDSAREPALSADELRALHRAMLLGRRLDERMVRLQRQGRIGTFAPIKGQEAAQMGSVFALRRTDWMVPSFRETAAMGTLLALHLGIIAAFFIMIPYGKLAHVVYRYAALVKNAVEQANKEISTRFDFKGSDARVEHKDNELTAFADDDFKLDQVKDVLISKMAKRNVDVRFLDYGKTEKISGDKVKQVITIKKGVTGDLSKKIVRMIKDSKIKVQASIQGDTVRVSGTKRDDLQSAIALVKKSVTDFPLQYQNFRD